MAKKYEAKIDSTTPSASGVKMYLLTPLKERDRKEDDGGGEGGRQHRHRDLRSALLRRHRGDSPISMWRKMFSSTMTPLSISREKTSASPPRIMVLIEPPMALVDQQADHHRKRNRQQHRNRGARAAEEDQNHHAGQHQPDGRFA